MQTYRLRFHHAKHEITERLRALADLAERVAVEQLMHELNPVDAAGYVVTFDVRAPDERVVAAGHFYVRATDVVGPTLMRRTRRD